MDPMIGRVFGKLTVIQEWKTNRNLRYLCECLCGNIAFPHKGSLISGKTRGCGCTQSEMTVKSNIARKQHGHYAGNKPSPTYNSWLSMKARCRNPQTNGYKYYGGRGITYCPEWETFSAFLADMGERPAHHTLDREDPDGNYSPSNCRWATIETQRGNRSKNHC